MIFLRSKSTCVWGWSAGMLEHVAWWHRVLTPLLSAQAGEAHVCKSSWVTRHPRGQRG